MRNLPMAICAFLRALPLVGSIGAPGRGKKAPATVWGIALCLWASMTFADSMRCGNRLVSTGDTKIEVLATCGEPFSREVIGEKTVERYYSDATVSKTMLVERWAYYFGPHEFIYYLTFEGDTLVDVESGGRP